MSLEVQALSFAFLDDTLSNYQKLCLWFEIALKSDVTAKEVHQVMSSVLVDILNNDRESYEEYLLYEG